MSQIFVKRAGYTPKKVVKEEAPKVEQECMVAVTVSTPSIVGKTVFFKIKEDGQDIAGVVESVDGSFAKVKLCLPNHDGVLVMSQSSEVVINKDFVTEIDADVVKNKDVKAYNENVQISMGTRSVPVKENDVIVDWQDVVFEGYASTFQSVTSEDRDGDYVLPNAFDKWINEFRRNPVILCDHTRETECLMGHYTTVDINSRGLYVVGKVTNSPMCEAKHIRFQLVEGSLKTLSIGGSFFYMDDMRGIEEVRLHEISLVVVPCNPDAMITTRSLTGEHAEKAFKEHVTKNGGIRPSYKVKNIA